MANHRVDDEVIFAFSRRLERLLSRRGKTQWWLAEEIGSTRQHINYLVNGVQAPSLATLIKISKVFRCTTDYLLGINGTKSCIVERGGSND